MILVMICLILIPVIGNSINNKDLTRLHDYLCHEERYRGSTTFRIHYRHYRKHPGVCVLVYR